MAKRTARSPARWRVVRDEAQSCQRCDLYKRATQTVFGAGPVRARLLLVGEQPGDAEDIAGEPFVGPAGELLRASLDEAGIDISEVYVTNVVKHFKWEPRGKRRIHQKPRNEEILACRYWLDQELAIVQPELIVALGATAVRALLGPKTQVMRDRGRVFPSEAGAVAVTVHPSSILRSPDEASRADARRAFVADLRAIAKRLRRPASAP